MDSTTYNLFEIAQKQFDYAADQLNLEKPIRDLLRVPMREYHFTIPVHMDNSETQILQGYRIQHNDSRGPCKGGIRFHPLQTVDTIRALSMWMTWRSAIVDIPLGGSMGCVVCDPHDLSLSEQERICRGWVRKISRDIGPDQDVPSPDLMTGGQHMMWMLDEYETIFSAKKPGFTTGKPVGLGGSFGRKEATGYGIMITIREALKEMSIKPDSTRASFQGFGNVAQSAIQLYNRMGGTTICVSCWNQESHSSLTFRKAQGINIEELLSITNPFGEIDKDKAVRMGYDCLPGDAWLEQEVDILVPAAIETQITRENVGNIHPGIKLIAEGANGSINPQAESTLTDKGVMVIPDLLANAGDVICSYFEQVQSNMNYYWRKDEVLGKLDSHMTSAYIDVRDFARTNDLKLRDAVYVIAVERVAHACHERGWA